MAVMLVTHSKYNTSPSLALFSSFFFLKKSFPVKRSISGNREAGGHSLSQQGVWVLFWTPKPLKRTPQDTQIF